MTPVLVPRKLTHLYDAVTQLGSYLLTGTRTQKYMTAFKAYEAVCPQPLLSLASIRHGLSHTGIALTRPKTKAHLEAIFGTVLIDLTKDSHVTLLYKHLGILLIETDRELASALLSERSSWFRPSGAVRLLHEWEVRAAPRTV